VTPVRLLVLFLEPPKLPGFVRLDPAEPLVPPAVAEQRRHRREGVHRDHQQRVVEEVKAATHAATEVHVVGVAPVRGEDRDDRLQRRRLQRGDL
jgi:hypothetical protein